MANILQYARGSEMQEAFDRANFMKNPNNYKQIGENLKKKVYDAKIHYYGSRIMGVGTNDSDIDIFIEVENSYYQGLPKDVVESYIKPLQEKMLSDQAWAIQAVNLHAPVPFIRAQFITFDMLCDITFSSGQGVQNTKMLRHLFEIQPEAAKLAIFMKKWFRLRNFAFKNYNVVLLTLFYLQQSGFLPSIKLVNELGPYRILINNFEVQFDEYLNLRHYHCNLLADFVSCLKGFFDFYMSIDYEDSVISPHSGDLEDRGRNHSDPEWRKPMVLTGPISKSKNHTFNVSKKTLDNFIGICQFSKNRLLSNN